jgi:hypothetical protein
MLHCSLPRFTVFTVGELKALCYIYAMSIDFFSGFLVVARKSRFSLLKEKNGFAGSSTIDYFR